MMHKMAAIRMTAFATFISCLFVPTQQQITIDMKCNPRLDHRLDVCPTGYCCVRDEFLPTIVYCKRSGLVREDCSTRVTETNCPCGDGLRCKPNIVSSSGVISLYGRCVAAQTTTTANTATTTTATTTERPTTSATTVPTTSMEMPTSADAATTPDLVTIDASMTDIPWDHTHKGEERMTTKDPLIG
eukprot:GHVL01034140.1.p1 GENE.GHVL01034140.1~~GHVL01034140.1.p1  ORF type:complete len:187 (+),score=7.09 GHVL01034140.1:97-657(+)